MIVNILRTNCLEMEEYHLLVFFMRLVLCSSDKRSNRYIFSNYSLSLAQLRALGVWLYAISLSFHKEMAKENRFR